MYYKIEDHEELVRDSTSRAVLNTDTDSLRAYKKRRAAILEKDREVDMLRNEINQLKDIVNNLIAEKNK